MYPGLGMNQAPLEIVDETAFFLTPSLSLFAADRADVPRPRHQPSTTRNCRRWGLQETMGIKGHDGDDGRRRGYEVLGMGDDGDMPVEKGDDDGR